MPNYQKKRRGPFEILIDILDNARSPISITHLMNKANLNKRTLDKFIQFLEEREFLERLEPPMTSQNIPKDRKHKKFLLVSTKGNEVIKKIKYPPIMELREFRFTKGE